MSKGYKTGSGVAEELMRQFDLAERAIASLGVVVWPMVEFEADDALATAAHWWQDEPSVRQVVICSPDKDLTQMVQGQKVVCLDRRRGIIYDQATVVGGNDGPLSPKGGSVIGLSAIRRLDLPADLTVLLIPEDDPATDEHLLAACKGFVEEPTDACQL